MATFTATAESASTIGYAQYGSTTWNTGTSNGAGQGAYQNTSPSGSRVGVMVFSGAGALLQGKTITQITLRITCSAAGSAASNKVLSFRRANYQTLQTGITGSAQVGATLGTLTGTFYGNTATHTLNVSTNAALFAAMKTYLAAGNSCGIHRGRRLCRGMEGFCLRMRQSEDRRARLDALVQAALYPI